MMGTEIWEKTDPALKPRTQGGAPFRRLRGCHKERSKQWWGGRLAQSVKHVTLDLGVVGLSPTLGVEIT